MKISLIIVFAFTAIISVGQNMELREVSATNTETKEVIAPNSEEEIYNIVDEMPSFPGGQTEMLKFIQKNIKYPQSAKEKGIGGKSYLRYIIRADGTITDIKVLKGAPGCPECDEEAVRLVKLMPKWVPGKQEGKYVSTYWNLPVNFEMKK